ncbi:MAG: heavy metal translocating P-type ATPase [Candidatus Atribacteria bacterium]|nr:heavy metal translocating P-type ATPase [Candidatus Atribacteria bacterium]
MYTVTEMEDLKMRRTDNRANGVKVLRSFEGYLRVKAKVFRNPKSPKGKKLLQRIFSLEGIEKVKINFFLSTCLINYNPYVLREASILAIMGKGYVEQRQDPKDLPSPFDFTVLGRAIKEIKFSRLGKLVSNWEIVHKIPGRVRLNHPLLYRSRLYCQHIEKLLFNTVGIEKYKSNSTTSTVLIIYDETKITLEQLLPMLEMTLNKARRKVRGKDFLQPEFAIITASLGLAAVGTYAVPALLPFSMLLVYFTAMPSLKGALHCLFKERRIGVDILDSIITILCLLTGEVFAAALMVWCLGIGKTILDKTSDQSRKLLTEAFGKQPNFAWLFKDNQEIQVSIDSLRPEDIVVVNTGEQIPIDGQVHNGEAMVDQHSLTGESAPVEKRTGDLCYASTVILAGMLYISVKESGESTTASKIKKIIEQTANYKVKAQSVGEKIADQAVIPTLGLASLGYMTGGQGAALAIINCDFGTGIRVAAPTALLASLIVSAKNGILVKKGQVLEDLCGVKTFIFDKTGTLTHEVPEVKEIICNDGKFRPQDVLFYAAIAEQKFTHPIAKAILKKAEECNVKMEKRDDTKYDIGFGIKVTLNGNIIKVGSQRYMDRENIDIPTFIHKQLETIRIKGGSSVMVAVDNVLAGAIELESSHRAEAYDVIQGLRRRGVQDIALISGDHEAPTKMLAEKLGIDTVYSEVLPQDKLRYVKMFQGKGKKVAMVGDGINDAPALSRADVSISLRGASDIAVDVADVLFMDGNLNKINLLYDISNNLKKNVRRSFALIVIPNSICILGAMFGVMGLSHSLILNNGANFIATLNGALPLGKAFDDKDREFYAPKNLR